MDFVKELAAKIAAFFGQVLVALGFATDKQLGDAEDKANDFINDWKEIIG